MSYTQPQPALPTMSGTWWAMVLRGIAAVLFGLAALFWPGLTLFVLLLRFGVYALMDGLLASHPNRPTSGIDAKQSETGKET